MKKPRATAFWKGSGKAGSGTLSTKSQALNEAPYSFKSRMEETPHTNPEELLAAAHAGCFTMKLAFLLEDAGFIPEKLETTCDIVFIAGEIKESRLAVTARIQGISPSQFDHAVKQAGEECPVSKLFNTKISVTGILE